MGAGGNTTCLCNVRRLSHYFYYLVERARSNRLLRPFIVFVVSLCLISALRAEEITLFNGKDLAGWKHAGPGSFTVKDGELHTDGGMGLLWYSEKEFGDYTLSLEFKVSRKQDNSGIFVRFP